MTRAIFISILFFNNILCSQQNLNIDYKPISSKGILPQIFTKDIKETIKEDLNELNGTTDADIKIKKEYYYAANYEIEKKVKSGNTLINDEITLYLNQIVDTLLKNDTVLRKKINLFSLKSAVVNAYCYDKGYLFMDVGMVAQIENEAQLAYVLCHEITHYVKKHNILGYIHDEKLEASVEGKNEESLLQEKCQYSKEQESEADFEGLKLLQKTKYDLRLAKGIFDILQYDKLPFSLIEFNKSFFETDNFKIPNYYLLKELAPIRNNSNEDDSESTHPNTSKRKMAVESLIAQFGNNERATNLLGEQKFSYITDLARFEVCRLHLKNRDYHNSLYDAYILMQKYPNNLFLAQTVSKCLYAILLYRLGYLRYNKDSYLDGPIHYLEMQSYPQQLFHIINKMPDNEWNIMALNYVYRKHKQFSSDKILGVISDSLFSMMKYVNGNIFTNTSKYVININANKDTANYYKNVFADLFKNDAEFATKFPTTIGVDFVMPYTPKSYSVNKYNKTFRVVDKIDKLLSLEPFYVMFDDNENQCNYEESKTQKLHLIESIKECVSNQKFDIVVLDPGLINANEVTKMNDYSVVCDWLYERMDGRDNEKTRVPVFSADEIESIIKTYGTSHVLKTGFVVLKGKRNFYVFYSVIYDLRENREVYIKQEFFKGQLSKAEAKNKICNLFNDLKNGFKQKQ